jgi:hypothetical protein
VGPEVEKKTGFLLRDGAAAGMLGLFEHGDFPARLG